MLAVVAKVGLGLLATAGVGTAVVVAVSPADTAVSQIVVTRHIDGDTFDVDINGHPERIRLLNIDTPETKDPDRPVQCLGPEASAFLARMIPVGSALRLEFDKQRKDRYGRTLAAAFTSEGKLVNAEVARAGFAQVVTYGNNVRFHPPIKAAWRDAAAAKRGLHSLDVRCTLPAQVKAVADSVDQAPTAASQSANADSSDLHSAAARTGAARRSAAALLKTLHRLRTQVAWTALTPREQARLRRVAGAARKTAAREENALRDAAAAAGVREEEAARAAEVARMAREAEAERAAEAEANRSTDADSSAAESAGDGNPSGYTGPRCYAPGGKTWRPC